MFIGKKTILGLAILFSASLKLQAQSAFYGLNFAGNGEFGGIFKTDKNGNNFENIYSFEGISGAYPTYSQLCPAGDGRLYGLSSQGGLFGFGVLYAYNPADNTYSKCLDFDGFAKGRSPAGSLMRLNDSLLYGMCTQGGSNNEGVLFVYNTASKIYSKLHDFSSGSSGKFPYGSLEAAGNGKLYGLCYQGGNANEGVLFEFDLTNADLRIKIHFNGSNGRNPFGSLLRAGNGLLYGMCYQGGINNAGVLFSYNVADSNFNIRQHFDGSNNGSNPYGSLCAYDDSTLYGMTFLGGSSNAGVLFAFNTANDSLLKRHDFGGSGNGRNPYGNVLKASDGKLYGMCYSGGNSNAGTIFTYSPANDTYSIIRHFTGGNDGRNPYGSLFENKDSILYGSTYRGGGNNAGTIFAYHPYTSSYVKKIDFSAAPNGKNALGSLIQAGNGKLYGLTQFGGKHNRGALFSFDPANEAFTKLHDFDGSNSGAYPKSGLTLAENGLLYGMCEQGGTYGYGVVFEFDPFNDSYDKLMDFDGSNGSNPSGNLYADGKGRLFGMTAYGGSDDYGVLFSLDIKTNAYTKRLDFNDSSNGSSPFGSLTGTGSGKLYGMTYQGGSYSAGILFSYHPDSTIFRTIHHFGRQSDGAYPQGSLSVGDNGYLYGMTSLGGNTNAGCIFMYDPAADSLFKVFDFNDSNGRKPSGNLVKTYDGKWLGMSPYGGAGDAGVLFGFDPSGYTLLKKHDFSPQNGSNPFGSLCPVCLPVYSNISLSSCDSLKAFSGKRVWYASGDYSDTLSTYTGCDSIVRISLNIKRRSFANIDTAVCSFFTGPDANRYDSSGQYRIVVPNSSGCDSIITLRLRILNSYSSISATACDTFTAPDGKQYTLSGRYKAVIQNAAGCDSSIDIQLRILNTESRVDTTVCFSYRAADGQMLDSSGQYRIVVVNTAGCDSNILVNLTVNKVNTRVFTNDNILSAEAENAAYQWLDCNNAYAPLSGENSRLYTAQKNGLYAVQITENSCMDTSDCVAVTSLSTILNSNEKLWQLFPNPNNGNFTLILNQAYNNIRVEISDAGGRTVYRSLLSNASRFDVASELSSGIYTLRLEFGHTNQTPVQVFIPLSICR